MGLIRNTMVFTALAAMAGTATAQSSSVTLYGVVDNFVQYLDNGGAHSFSDRSGGSTGSMFGFAGTEDLGGGLKAKFVLENGFTTNNGAFYVDSSVLFYRQAWVGLQDEKYGALTVGRQYTPSFLISYPTDPFRLNENLSPVATDVLAADKATLSTQYDSGRANNSILYKSPNFYGLKLYGMYAFSATVAAPVPATMGNELNVGASYSIRGLYAGLAYVKQHPGQETIVSIPAALGPLGLVGTTHYVGALAYTAGIVTLQANYSYVSPDDAAARSLAAKLGTAHAYSTLEVGATVQATPADQIEIAISDRDVRGAHDNAPAIQVGVDHSLSKRTSVYMRAGYIKNNGSSTTSWPGISVTAPGAKQVLAGVGITHRF